MPYTAGQLIHMKRGWYFRVKHEKDTKPWQNSIHPRTYVQETEKGLILEHQGTKANNGCWHVLVNGTVVIAWDDSFRGGVDESA